jgi:hypothetical protein
MIIHNPNKGKKKEQFRAISQDFAKDGTSEF